MLVEIFRIGSVPVADMPAGLLADLLAGNRDHIYEIAEEDWRYLLRFVFEAEPSRLMGGQVRYRPKPGREREFVDFVARLEKPDAG